MGKKILQKQKTLTKQEIAENLEKAIFRATLREEQSINIHSNPGIAAKKKEKSPFVVTRDFIFDHRIDSAATIITIVANKNQNEWSGDPTEKMLIVGRDGKRSVELDFSPNMHQATYGMWISKEHEIEQGLQAVSVLRKHLDLIEKSLESRKKQLKSSPKSNLAQEQQAIGPDDFDL